MATVLKTVSPPEGADQIIPSPDEVTDKMLVSPPRIVNGVTWAFAPDWLTVSQACELSNYDRGFMLQVVEAGGVDLDCAGRIEKKSLWEWLEVSAEIDHWDD